LAGSASVSISGGTITYAVGRVFISAIFEQGGDFDNLDMGCRKKLHLKNTRKNRKKTVCYQSYK
jgi:hypothetical protein